MRNYKPSEHSDTANVAPLVQFFELVHIGDTIQSIMQVYFDKELVSPHFQPLGLRFVFIVCMMCSLSRHHTLTKPTS